MLQCEKFATSFLLSYRHYGLQYAVNSLKLKPIDKIYGVT